MIIKAIAYPDYLMHYGVSINDGAPGVGTGNWRRGRRSVFISGSSKTQNPDSEYYRKDLNTNVKKAIDEYISQNVRINVGDAPGIDRQVQDYLKEKNYDNVVVYGPGKKVRYSANSKWKTKPVDAPEYEEGSKEWLAKKDIAMKDDSTEGFAIILDEGAKATRNNVSRLIEDNKNVKVFQLNKDGSDDYVNPEDFPLYGWNYKVEEDKPRIIKAYVK